MATDYNGAIALDLQGINYCTNSATKRKGKESHFLKLGGMLKEPWSF
jgi:hypothetical protein